MYIGRLLSAGIFSLVLSFFIGSTFPPSLPQSASQPAPKDAASTSHVSRNWAGYVANNGTFTSISGTWVVPQVNGDISGADATWVGIGGVDTHDLIQAGTQATVEENGRVSYEAFWETLPNISQPFNMNISPGDTIVASVKREQNGQWHISLQDKDSGEKSDVNVPYDSSLSSAEWIEEAPSGMHYTIPLDNFGTVSFKEATTIRNGNSVSLTQAGASPLAMGDMYGQTLATTSVVGKDGGSFSVSRILAEEDTYRQNPLALYRLRIRRFLEGGFSFEGR